MRTLSFAGTDDPVMRPGDYEKARKYYSSEHRVVAMPGGHFMHREHPERFTKELVASIAKV